jgi:hypothetical protein
MRTAFANHDRVRGGSVDSTFATNEFLNRLTLSPHGRVTSARLSRPDKRNAIDDKMIEAIGAAFRRLPKGTYAVVLHGEGTIFAPAPTWTNSRNTAGWISCVCPEAGARSWIGSSMVRCR